MSGSSGWGLERTNRELAEGLAHALHCRVKWGDRPEDAATLAVMLMKVLGTPGGTLAVCFCSWVNLGPAGLLSFCPIP